MPAATTHAEFAKRVYDELDESIKKKITSMPMYYLGAQGPDLLLFHRYMFLPNSLNQYGSLMHREKVKEAIAYFRRHALTPSLRSYFLGYLTHYALDSTAHPIIYAYAKRESEEEGISQNEAHFRIEGEVDAWILNQSGRSVHDYSIYRMLRISKEEVKELARMYHGLFEEVYAMNIPAKLFEGACHDCMRITRQLKPGNIKHRVVRTMETMVRVPHLVTSMMLTDKENAEPSVLNPDHEEWVYYGVFNASFPELFDQAKDYAKKLMADPQESLLKKNFAGIPFGETVLSDDSSSAL